MIQIAPSILSADFSQLSQQIKEAEKAGADWFHLDVMDGHFVPNITFGPLMVEVVKKLTSLPLDVHLMIENPDNYLERFIHAGAQYLTVHVEAVTHLHRTIDLIKRNGAKAGVALNPATPVNVLEEILPNVDLILVMSVNPGFGGQAFIPQSLEKIQKISNLIKQGNHDVVIEVDGGIDKTIALSVVEAGASVLVAGSAIFKTRDIQQALQEIRNSIQIHTE
ncbi:MAG: ribulose-phosphate 3-epimerase [bacterium]